jgi:Ca-activated chloride channel family protein
VWSEVLFQEAQHSKRLASEAIEMATGSPPSGCWTRLSSHSEKLDRRHPESLRAELERELDEVTYMGEQSIVGDASFVSTLTRESSHRQNRKRGRGPDDGQYDSTCA